MNKNEKIFLIEEFNKNIPKTTREALAFCSKVADENDLPIFLIGGIVRDIIIDQKNFDVDVVIRGNAINFAKLVENKYFKICKIVEIHDDFKTAKILFNIDGETVHIDLASTRKESYPCPGSLPYIEEIGCELYDDVIRRDFSINSMALSLNNDSFGELVDYLGGYEDLKAKKLRVLHSVSFVDDPTRIIRGLKFSVRFGYEYDKYTKKLMKECLNSGMFDNFAGERIKQELKQTFNLNRAECFIRFMKENIYRLVDTSVSVPEDIDSLGFDCFQVIEKFSDFLPAPDNIWLIYLGVSFIDFSQEKIVQISERLYLSGIETRVLCEAKELDQNKEILNNVRERFEIYEFFEKIQVETIIIFLINNEWAKDKVCLYLEELKNISISVNGSALLNMGIEQGPFVGEVLRRVLKARINQEIFTPDEEVAFIETLINPSR